MAADERNPNPEKSFEKALARHLRSLAPSREAAGLRPDSFAQTASCPDAETLAAYHERSLLPGELNSWKEHIVGCPHCQQILAQLEATDGIPLQATEPEEILAMKESAAASSNRESFSSAAAASSARRGAEAALPEKPRSIRFSSGVRWRWLAPAGALAAGLLVWIAIHEKQPGFPSSSEIKIAKRQEPPAPPPPLLTQPSTAPPPVLYSQSKPQASADETAPSNARSAPQSAKQHEKPDLQAETRAKSSRALADKETGARKDEQRDALRTLPRDANQIDLDSKKAVTSPAQQNAEIAAEMQSAQGAPPEQAANVPLQNQQNQSALNAQNVPGPAPLNQAPPAKKMKAAPAPVGGVAGLKPGTSMLQTMSVSNPRLIAPLRSNVIWRVGRNGLIEFSTDKGTSWTRQTSGVLVDLLTGSAPSEKVCWIVGRAGTILLTTDGGAHWKLLSSPLDEDLGGVLAADALHATIWNDQNTKRAGTSDGGLTWKLLPAP